jgi:hypothetical protein
MVNQASLIGLDLKASENAVECAICFRASETKVDRWYGPYPSGRSRQPAPEQSFRRAHLASDVRYGPDGLHSTPKNSAPIKVGDQTPLLVSQFVTAPSKAHREWRKNP